MERYAKSLYNKELVAATSIFTRRTEEQRTKMRALVTGRKHTEEAKANMRAARALRGPVHADTGRKISAAHKGRTRTQAEIAAAEKRRGATHPPRSVEALRRMSNAQKGKVRSPEHRAKLAAAALGRKNNRVITDETRRSMSEAQRGKILSPEHKAKIAATLKARNAAAPR
jgi:hypothetical protein